MKDSDFYKGFEMIDGQQIPIFKIKEKLVTEDVYNKLFADYQSSKAKSKNRNGQPKGNIEFGLIDKLRRDNVSNLEFGDSNETCACPRCEFIKNIVVELNKCDDDEKFDLLNQAFHEIEEQATENGCRIGMENILRQQVEMNNRLIYNLDNAEFILEYGNIEYED